MIKMVYIYSLKLQQDKYYIGKTINPNFRLENHFYNLGSSWTKKFIPISIHQVIPDQDNHDEQRVTQEYMAKYGIDNVRGGPWCKIILSVSEKTFIQTILSGERDECYQCGSNDHFAKDCKKPHVKKKQVKKKQVKKKVIKICKRCEWPGHSETTCYAKKTRSGKLISEFVEDDFDDDYDEPISWGCESCGKEFDSKKGCLFHENVHCPKRRGKSFKNGARLLQEELYDDTDTDDTDDTDDTICYRCDRPGHKSPACYAKSHKNGYLL